MLRPNCIVENFDFAVVIAGYDDVSWSGSRFVLGWFVFLERSVGIELGLALRAFVIVKASRVG